MAPTKHYVITPDGKRHTRTSQKRVYSHVIVLSPPKAGALGEIARESEAAQRAYAAKYDRVAAAAEAREEFTVKVEHHTRTFTYTRYRMAGEDVTVWVTEPRGPSADYSQEMPLKEGAHEEVARRYREAQANALAAAEVHAKVAAEYEAMDPDTEIGAWSVVGWSSSAALASPRARGRYLTDAAAKRGQSIRVLEAQIA